MSATNFTENLALNWLLTNGAATRPTAWFVGLHSADPTEAGNVSELSGNGYARVAVTFTTSTTGATANAGVVTFGPATGSAWATATHFSVWDASTAGNPLFKGALTASRTLNVGDTASFAIGELDVTAE